jgi:hypothetical protein
MKNRFLLAMLIAVVSVPALDAKNLRRNHTGTLVQMQSVHCGADDGGGVAKALFGAPMPVPGQEEKVCPEYILQSEGLYYRIRPREHKHPPLLPIGEQAQFQFQKDRLLLQVEDFDDETYEFSVLAIVPENHSESFWPRSHVIVGPPQ